MIKLIFASKNRGKIKEVKNIFAGSEYEITSLLELNDKFEIEENQITFEANAKKKAAEVFNHFNVPVIADDSGIEVEQLNNKPGVYSARYAGENAADEENNSKLINELKDYSEPHPARYVCCAVFYDGQNYLSEYGEIKGKIIFSGRGKNGFGYDPLFVPDGYNQTMAGLLYGEKNRISHRGKAFSQLKMKMNKLKEKK
jgi:XTP/dITP diphosphohydrolase